MLDDTGELLSVPSIVTRFVPGTLRLDTPADPLPWARSLAAMMLKKIHAIRLDEACRNFLLDEACRGFLLDANAEATWFLTGDSTLENMQSFSQAARPYGRHCVNCTSPCNR